MEEERIDQSDESFKNPVRSCYIGASTSQNQSGFRGFVFERKRKYLS